ncbi:MULTISPECIES: hypothetical protein [Acidianus]|uniref:Uncharacterized protein n=1 Tax=Candidatus Acidianus copahuensis TaxID=1160895 RepID=A0A031LS43_9CREN|nr:MULTISPECIES: hypothetical protein [Acidianus]EZQ10616.1 hypothetical protein CM19_03715 [Candidatus Acidianus copahuensis]NON62487.1 hypothetical protein [Acidianus sp. RZ1]
MSNVRTTLTPPVSPIIMFYGKSISGELILSRNTQAFQFPLRIVAITLDVIAPNTIPLTSPIGVTLTITFNKRTYLIYRRTFNTHEFHDNVIMGGENAVFTIPARNTAQFTVKAFPIPTKTLLNLLIYTEESNA